MVDKKKIPPVVLTPDMKQRLKELEEDQARVAHTIGVLEEVGLDVSDLKDKFEWSKKMRETLLKNFG